MTGSGRASRLHECSCGSPVYKGWESCPSCGSTEKKTHDGEDSRHWPALAAYIPVLVLYYTIISSVRTDELPGVLPVMHGLASALILWLILACLLLTALVFYEEEM